MNRREFSLTAIGAAVLAGCGGGGGGGGGGFPFPPVAGSPPPAPPAPPAPPVEPPVVIPPAPPNPPLGPELATPSSLPVSTIFAQSIVNNDGDKRSVGPGQANFWDLTPAFGIGDGWNGQFAEAWTLGVTVGRRTREFNGDQTFAELTPLGPEMTEADGLKVVTLSTEAPFQANDTSAFLHAVPDARLQQKIDLTGAVSPVRLFWNGMWGTFRGNFSDEEAYMRVVLLDTNGAVLQTLFNVDRDGNRMGRWASARLDAYVGQQVVLSFEQRAFGQGAYIDDVTASDSSPRSRELVVNGDFSAGFDGWTVVRPKVAQNIRSGLRDVNGLDVQRTFYAQPNLLWARLTDTFHNRGASPVTATVTYTSFLGSYGAGIIYPLPGVDVGVGATPGGLAVWDGMAADLGTGRVAGRDAGFVFGAASSVDYLSATALQTVGGSNRVQVTFEITVPAGGTVTLANFLILTGTNTGLTATDAAARATEVDTQAADIVKNFRTNFVYQRGLTQAQLDTLKNF
ncbi:hypothetical protein DBV14_26585 [Variovorax sp. KBW07]|nr:hypothetical protein DBV14_26585 [Variovorax sp. KBW07]